MKRIQIQYKNKLVVIIVSQINSIIGSVVEGVNVCEIFYPGCDQFGAFFRADIEEVLSFIDNNEKVLYINAENSAF